MPFGPRNAYYLRVSATLVLPLYLYLDERHLDWMSDIILQHVLADLRPKILPKMQTEARILFGSSAGGSKEKEGTVDVHRGETYQFAFFFRKTEPHCILLKTQSFVFRPPTQTPLPPPPEKSPEQRLGKRKGKKKPSAPNTRKKPKTKGKDRAQDEEELIISSEDDSNDATLKDAIARRRSKRSRKLVAGGLNQQDNDNLDSIGSENSDVEMIDNPDDSEADGSRVASPNLSDGNTDKVSRRASFGEGEENVKPQLQLSYEGFDIRGHCLCVIVEPWPPFQAGSEGHRITRAEGQSDASSPVLQVGPERNEALPPVPSFDPRRWEANSAGSELIAFGQAMAPAGDFVVHELDDDDEMDGAVFFADADEARRL